ncbi:MAG: response regulator, partial [Clostridia bacterium]|nr:response regulator [Clostridia bacterium]
MGRVTLYIADMDARFIDRVRRALAGHPDIAVSGSAGDGVHALEEIRRLNPDVLLTDISLPGLDGVALLRETRRLQRPPAVIICTRFCSDAIMACTCRLGASFFLCKPVEPAGLPGLILECQACRAP